MSTRNDIVRTIERSQTLRRGDWRWPVFRADAPMDVNVGRKPWQWSETAEKNARRQTRLNGHNWLESSEFHRALAYFAIPRLLECKDDMYSYPMCDEVPDFETWQAMIDCMIVGLYAMVDDELFYNGRYELRYFDFTQETYEWKNMEDEIEYEQLMMDYRALFGRFLGSLNV